MTRNQEMEVSSHPHIPMPGSGSSPAQSRVTINRWSCTIKEKASTHRPWPCPRLGLRVCRCWLCSRGCRASRSGDFHSCGPGHGGFNGLAEKIFHAYKVLKQFTITSLLREYCTLELCVELIMRNYPRSSKLALICIMQIIVMAAQHQAPGPCLFVFNFSSLMLYLCLELYWGTL